MFDQDELEELREDRHQWQGHVRRDVWTEKNTEISGRVFFSSAGASLLVAVMVGVLIISSNGALALLGIGGIGGFGAEITRLEGTGVQIYPAIGPTAACPSPMTGGDFTEGGGQGSEGVVLGDNSTHQGDPVTLPQLKADLSDAEIPPGEEILLYKDIPTPPITGMEMVRVNLGQQSSAPEQGNVSLGNASFTVTSLKADKLQAYNTEIKESFSNGTAEAPRLGSTGEFTVSGTAKNASNQVFLENATARAHFLSFEVLSMPYLKLDVQYYNDSSTANPEPVIGNNTCPVP